MIQEISDFEKKRACNLIWNAAADYGSYDMDIEPDDIEVTDTVTLVWEIV